MSDAVSPLLQWLNAHPQLAGLATFLISAAESVAIIGTIVPGSIMMTAIGTLAGAGVIPLWETIIWAILGAIAGDGISYWLGYHFKDRLVLIWPFNRHPGMLKTGELFFHKYGGMSVFIGRFVGPVRALVPLVAGMLGMKPWKFIIANVLSAIGWAPAYMLPGILLGAASLELPPGIAIHVILVVLLMTLFTLLCLWFIYKLLQLIHTQTNHLQNEIWRKLKGSRFFSPATFLLKHHDMEKTHGQLHLAIYFLIICLLLSGLIFYVKWTGVSFIQFNQAIFHLFRGIRNTHTDNLMINLTLLGQKQIVFLSIVLLSVLFLCLRRLRLTIHLIALGLLSAGSIYVLKHALKVSRPWGLLGNPESFSMPSGHATLASGFYICLAFFLGLALPKHRKLFYILALIIAFLVGLSRLYLGAHWFTDVLSGWLLGSAILLIIIISYNRKYEAPLKPTFAFFSIFLSVLISFAIYHHLRIDHLMTTYKPLQWPVAQVTMDNWWDHNNVIPAYQVSLFGFPTQKINIEWLGNLDEIKETLIQQGWSAPPARDWVSTLHRIADVSSTEYLPLISPQYLDERPELTLSKTTSKTKGLLVIRLWNAHRTINKDKVSLWVGTVGTIPRPYSWIFKSHPEEININATMVFSKTLSQPTWEWKVISRLFDNKSIPHQVLLVRKKQ